jgi:tetratricopeptide (TPR) repeat protein
MKGAIYFIIAGTIIGILTLFKPNFFWNHRKAAFVRRFLGDRGTTIFYLIVSVAMLTFGIYSMTKINSGKDLEEISTLYQDGKIDDAQKRLLRYTADHSDNYLAWTILGHTYYDQDSLEKAIDAYTKGTQADPKAFEPHSGLGITYVKMGEYEKAKEAYEVANQLSPNEGSVIANLAGLYDDLGDINKAIEYSEKSIRIDSTNATTYANLSIYYNKAQQFEKRDLMFNKAKQLGYDDMQSLTDAYNNYNDTTKTE